MQQMTELGKRTYFPWKLTENRLVWNKQHYPRLSVIIPSFNQGEYLEETLLSVLNQGYPNLELIVIDGGSIDNSVEIIKRHSNRIYHWVSEADKGQSHAINKGFEKATGEWIAWMNSDDCYLEGGLNYIFNQLDFSNYDFLHGSCASGSSFSTHGAPLIQQRNYKKNAANLLLFFYSTKYIIPSQSVFVRRSILERSGMLDESLNYVMDMEWFVRIFLCTNRIYFYRNAVCFFRHNPNAKTATGHSEGYKEAKAIAYKYLKDVNIFMRLKLVYLLKNKKPFADLVFINNPNVMNFLIALIKYPFIAIVNKHYWSLFRKKLVEKFS